MPDEVPTYLGERHVLYRAIQSIMDGQRGDEHQAIARVAQPDQRWATRCDSSLSRAEVAERDMGQAG